LLYFVTTLAFNAPGGGVPLGQLHKILHVSHRMAKVHSGEEILPKALTACVGCTNVTDIQTDDRQTELREQRPKRNVVTFG